MLKDQRFLFVFCKTMLNMMKTILNVEMFQMDDYIPVIGRNDLEQNRHKDKIIDLQRRNQISRANYWQQKEEDNYNRAQSVQDNKT